MSDAGLDGKVSIIARLTVKADKADEFAAQWDELMAHVAENEPGCLMYMLHRSSTDPTQFFVTELYENQAAVDAHMASDAFAAFGARLGDFIESADLQLANPVKSAKSWEPGPSVDA